MTKKPNSRFIRAIWGTTNPEHKFHKFRDSLTPEVDDTVLYNQFSEPFVTYILGRENYEWFVDRYPKAEAVLVQDDPFFNSTRVWPNKMFILKKAMEDFDEIIYMDWDTEAIKKCPKTIWETLRTKEVFQAPLYKYGHAKINWRRRGGNKFVPCGAFVYIRDKSIPENMLNMDSKYDLPNKYLDEVYFAKQTDELMGGWKGTQEYKERFEPPFCNIRNGVFIKNEVCFFHASSCRRRRIRKRNFKRRLKNG